MAIELNLLSFIPLISNSSSSQETEATIKYFLAQRLGSGILLIRRMLIFYKISTPINMYVILFSSLLLKLGIAPFHF
jgi:NADH:ubiquinone oxidoreductase subunit 2 (subunit N)